ncbi:Isochorismatase hydrolase [Annulohypoxylon maeteangense]|uniref:Isochorismatase hydrolase n=1 Tax=Annulohypoxylon maeteangense TaxID=1927788 RepID=UPI0020080EB2|nr:Isochorismatase hydrolase [Annulohypoxylon maeteangense]KAI0887227.1 Isochorismatase hydrolase [Annulohypoxylon maeteangense]
MSFMRASTSTFVRGIRTRPITPFCYQYGQKPFSTTTMSSGPQRRFLRPAILICDMQERFRTGIWQFDKIILTAQKILRAAQILKISVYVTTQNAAKLGATVSELTDLIAGAEVNVDKTAFSMLRAPEIEAHFPIVLPPEATEQREVAIVGIESHICVTQTALDLLARGHKVYVLADGVSSCNTEEIPVALARLTEAGATVTTSESWLFECMGDAAIPEFRDMAALVKQTSESSKTVLGSLLARI